MAFRLPLGYFSAVIQLRTKNQYTICGGWTGPQTAITGNGHHLSCHSRGL